MLQLNITNPFNFRFTLVEQQQPKKVKTTFPAKLSLAKLDPDGWSVPVRSSISDFRMVTPGVCLALVDEATRVMQELKTNQVTAKIVPTNF